MFSFRHGMRKENKMMTQCKKNGEPHTVAHAKIRCSCWMWARKRGIFVREICTINDNKLMVFRIWGEKHTPQERHTEAIALIAINNNNNKKNKRQRSCRVLFDLLWNGSSGVCNFIGDERDCSLLSTLEYCCDFTSNMTIRSRKNNANSRFRPIGERLRSRQWNYVEKCFTCSWLFDSRHWKLVNKFTRSIPPSHVYFALI